MDIKSLCPGPSTWQIVLLSLRPDRIVIHLEPLKREARCPQCGTLSRRIHSRYLRHPWDLPWSRWPVQLCIITRRFFCDSPSCQRSIFSEPFPELLEPYAHQTVRLQKALLEMAHISSAEGAAQIAGVVGYFTSGDSLLRRQRREQVMIPEPRVIGVDEFAFRRGITYGTVIVDLEKHRPIAVLESDQADPFSEWLLAHPGIEIITRDRDETYAIAGKQAAPQAIQVADRFHLVRNIGEALKKFYRSRKWKITQNAGILPVVPDQKPGIIPRGFGPQPTPLKQARWEEVQQRRQDRQSIQGISRDMGIKRDTVRRYLALDSPPIYTRPPRPKVTVPFLPYLQKRWEEGCHNARQLYREIYQLGYRNKERRVRETVHPWRTEQPLPRPVPSPPVAHWVLCPRNHLKAEETDHLDQILDLNPLLETGYWLKERFLAIIHQGDTVGLDAWLEEAANSELKVFRGLSASLRRDLAAVRNALILPWSNAQCEGQICRVKLIKRIGYGRAKIDLLRKRILHRMVTG